MDHYLPLGADQHIHRDVEFVFIRAPFHNRCKPRPSNHGVGLELRQASTDACTQFSRLLEPPVLSQRYGLPQRIHLGSFSNAFLGVLMPEVELMAAPKFKRGPRFDWLYDRMVTTGRLEPLLSRHLDLPDVVWHGLRTETHEWRAALICLLTAALGRERHGRNHRRS